MGRVWIERGEPFERLFSTFTTSVWRWECQGEYHEPVEDAPFQQWREGSRDDAWLQPWAQFVRGLRQDGKTFSRVRMLTEPLTDYLRWMLDFTYVNVDAGEDIRWIEQHQARELGAPTHDFYVFDDVRVGILHFDDAGVAGVELDDDVDVLRKHQQWRDLVWPLAVPHREYLAQHRQRSP